ncbi:MAG: hypothetical protein J5982_02845 [Bacilli bacterium]|nr:hypothetical protein [Bacilli bacterium]
MNNIKKLSTYIFLLICLLLILFGIFVLHSNKNLKSKVDSAENFELIFYYKEKRGKELIIDKENGLYNYNIYVVNGTVDIVIDKKNYSLEDALNNKRVTMEKIIEKAKKDIDNPIFYDDGGSTEYHYRDYTIIKKDTIDGDSDVYIGDSNLSLHSLNN